MKTILLIAAMFGAVTSDRHSLHHHGPAVRPLLWPHEPPHSHPHKHQQIQRLHPRYVHQEPLLPISHFGSPVLTHIPQRILHQKHHGPHAPHQHHRHPSFQEDDDVLWNLDDAAKMRIIMKYLMILSSLNEAEDDNRAYIGDGIRRPGQRRRSNIFWNKVRRNQPKPKRPSGNARNSGKVLEQFSDD